MLKLLGNVLAAPIKGPVRGFEAVVKAIQEEAESEALDESKVQGDLMRLELSFQAGEIDEAAYHAKEDELLERLNEIRNYKESLAEEETDPSASETSVEDETEDVS